MDDRSFRRFASKLKPDLETGCLLWTAYTMQNGYGQFGMGGKTVLAHRTAYEHWVGRIPTGLVLDHLCRVRSCCNPDHLEPVTNAENIRRGAAVRTSCKQGHEFDVDNTSWSRGSRTCLVCHRRGEKQRRARVALQANRQIQTDNRHKTHCPSQHEYTQENTYTDKKNRRTCVACSREHQRQRRAAARDSS